MFQNKYRNIKTELNGRIFDSQKEARRSFELTLLQNAGQIQGLEWQKRYEIVPKSKHGRALFYIADFVYTQNGKTVVEDVKSPASRTAVYKLKKRLMAEIYEIIIWEV